MRRALVLLSLGGCYTQPGEPACDSVDVCRAYEERQSVCGLGLDSLSECLERRRARLDVVASGQCELAACVADLEARDCSFDVERCWDRVQATTEARDEFAAECVATRAECPADEQHDPALCTVVYVWELQSAACFEEACVDREACLRERQREVD